MTMRIGIVALAALIAAPAIAQGPYRQGVPDVLTPPPPPPSRLTVAAGEFRARYARAGSPRIILFWNRVLSDEVQSQYANRVSAMTTSQSGVIGGRVGYSGYAAAGANVNTFDAAATRERVREGERDSMAESADWKVETAFNRAFIDNGARFVDRAVAMRNTARGRRLGTDPNVQEIETSALVGKADLLMEVLQTPDPDSPVGYSFRAEVKDVRTGRILATVVNDGSNIRNGPGRFVATSSGFQREAPREISLQDIGRALAADLMGALSSRWS